VEEETTYGLSPEQLAHLLAMGLHQEDDQGSGEGSRTNSDMLQHMLMSELPLDPAMPESVPVVLKRPCEELSDVVGQTLSQLLLNSQTGFEVIQTLKDYAKALSRRGTQAKARSGGRHLLRRHRQRPCVSPAQNYTAFL